MDEIIDHQQQSGKKVSHCPNIFASLVGLTLGSYSLYATATGSEQSAVEYANSYITILNGAINGW